MQIEENVPLAPFTTLKIGGPARYFVRATNESEVQDAAAMARDRRLPLFVLGGGSNVVVPDEGFAGIVLQMNFPESIVREDVAEAHFLNVSAGTDWDALVLKVSRQGISGMECLAGIPGLVGGSPIQNIGAYGQEVSHLIESVRAFDCGTGMYVTLGRQECQFSYRSSRFNSTHRGRYIVTSVRFELQANALPNLTYADLAPLRGIGATPMDVYHAVRAIRDRKGMLIDAANAIADSRSAGSFFKNPVVPASMLDDIAGAAGVDNAQVPHWLAETAKIKISAAWLIERAGFPKGYAETSESTVGISSRHTLALVNRSGGATCRELLSLRDHLTAGVARKFGIVLEQEPVLLR